MPNIHLRSRGLRRAFALLLLAGGPRFSTAAQPVRVSAADAPTATPRLLQKLATGAQTVRVIVGVKDGTPSARELRLSPDPAGEKERRVARISAQQTIADSMPGTQFQPSQFYESFSMIAGTASREGVIALARRPDVAWIHVDGIKRKMQVGAAASPQAAQLLIRSSDANALGFNGAGRAIAVIDTGVDYTTADMGGGGFPNAKVIGGTDIADLDNDPADCDTDGHGTEVSDVAAGPNGVAPAAKIVAVKVFSSKNSCDEGNDSDILQGINYAITNKARFGIVALNLSLGGEWTDTDPHGFCDNDEPAYESAFDLAIATGIVPVVAAGNGARNDALAVPACMSSAVSVGAVYTGDYSRVHWLGDPECTDSPASPDQVVCFSDSATNLSLLGPGAFWIAAGKGGTVDQTFAGTSASSPSVAGAVAVLSQARPELSPASLVALMRASGKPVTDTRNGIVTPRLDVLAAVQLAAAKLSSYTGAPVSIPDGSGSATATVTTSGFTGTLGTVQVWVQIDHPEPEQLRLTLIGPDGTSVLLRDQTGSSEHPINAYYGKTDAAAQSLDLFAAHPGNGVWTLKVEDLVAGTTGRIKNFSIQLVAALAPCVPGPQTLCLNANRFQASVNWQVPSQGTSGVGTAVPLTADTGYYWFFSANNVELVVKVVDGRAVNGKFWVFYGALTNVQYTITVTDTLTGNQQTYTNPDGTQGSRADTNAF